METPFCHRTITADVLVPMSTPGGGMYLGTYDTKPRPCLGSRCAMWCDVRHGRGYCRENENRDAWLDPIFSSEADPAAPAPEVKP